MKKETLLRAKELDGRITAIEEEIKLWERATSFHNSRVELKYGKATPFFASLDNVGFDAVKGIVLSQLKSQLQTVQKDFDKL